MVWGGICTEGRTSLARVSIRLNGEQYVNLLKEYLFPSARPLSSNRYIFMQDNAPCHTAAVTKHFLSNEDITALEWPAQSPDLNLIEHLWDWIEKELRSQCQHYSNKEILWSAIKDIWERSSQDVIRSLINSMPRRIEAIIKARGGHTSY